MRKIFLFCSTISKETTDHFTYNWGENRSERVWVLYLYYGMEDFCLWDSSQFDVSQY
jgi:uncharacterized protein with ParB-like and HNH nuclease domain